MSKQELFERIVMSLHAAVLDDSGWPATSGLIDELCESEGNFLVFGDSDSPGKLDLFFSRLCYRGERDEELEREYFEVYYPADERLPRIRQLPDSQIVPVRSLFTEEEIKHSRVYNESLSRNMAGDSLNVRLDGPRGSRIVWAIGDPVDSRGWSFERVGTIERLLPHLRQFVRVRQALVDARALGSSLAALLENTRCGVIQLDPRGRIVGANDRARNLLRKGEGLTDRDSLLRASAAEDDRRLRTLLARALPRFGGQGASASMTVGRPDSQPLVLHACPIGGGGAELRPSRVAALVLVVDPVGRGDIDANQIQALLGLTRAQSRVAVSLAEGGTIGDIARATGRSETTVRWHVRRVFAKLGVSRQVDLVKVVLAVPDVPRTPG